ncbi:hypothetical protein LshimejAT787_0705800 [Lyophyllum shimeji]|uniref:Uncharacterized protein n=1 Tax=Lyophyllum shimeji TaxID=47721 RepID=A0A9P3PQA5_LYOSH|nr:hypothetical protein LshimejAT787_0705800 [Lyophyllum shimeji]
MTAIYTDLQLGSDALCTHLRWLANYIDPVVVDSFLVYRDLTFTGDTGIGGYTCRTSVCGPLFSVQLGDPSACDLTTPGQRQNPGSASVHRQPSRLRSAQCSYVPAALAKRLLIRLTLTRDGLLALPVDLGNVKAQSLF